MSTVLYFLKNVKPCSFIRFSNRPIRQMHLWTNDNIVKSPHGTIDIPNTTVVDYIWSGLDKWSQKTALVCGITNRSYTYEKIYKRSRAFGANLRKKFKIQDGDVVGVMMTNVPEYAIAVFGVLSAGGVVTTLNPIYTAYEVERQLKLSEAKLIIVHPDIVTVVKNAFKLSSTNIPIIVMDIEKQRLDGTISFKELIEDKHVDLDILKQVKRNADDVSFLPYSSGTTGLPKGVELTNKNIVANCEQQNLDSFNLVKPTNENHQDIGLLLLPLFHSYGLGVLLLHKLSLGLKLVTLPSFTPDTFLNALFEYSINILYVVPPINEYEFRIPDAITLPFNKHLHSLKGGKASVLPMFMGSGAHLSLVLFLGTSNLVKDKHLKSLTMINSGAAPLPTADYQKLKNRVLSTAQITQGYGLTETSPVVTFGHQNENNSKSVGFALPNIELRILDENLNSLGPNKVGELVIKGPNVMKGYKNNEEANKQVFLEGGWFRSGDLASIDENGEITIADRLKELIKVKGFQVPPAELENVLKEHPAVFDAAVIGIADDITGEKPKAFVVKNKNTRVTDREIIEFVNERVASYKRIKDLMFLDEIPKNPSGKILRRVLKEKYL